MNDSQVNRGIDAMQANKSGAQIHAQAAEIKKQVMNIVGDVKLRQWCVEQSGGTVKNAQEIYNFVTMASDQS